MVDQLRQTGDLVAALTFVAVAGDTVVGHVACSQGTVGARTRLLALGPLGVTPSWQNRGVGRALVEAAIKGADARGEPALVLLGSPRYYGRFGFEKAADRGGEPRCGVGLGVPDAAAHDVHVVVVARDVSLRRAVRRPAVEGPGAGRGPFRPAFQQAPIIDIMSTSVRNGDRERVPRPFSSGLTGRGRSRHLRETHSNSGRAVPEK